MIEHNCKYKRNTKSIITPSTYVHSTNAVVGTAAGVDSGSGWRRTRTRCSPCWPGMFMPRSIWGSPTNKVVLSHPKSMVLLLWWSFPPANGGRCSRCSTTVLEAQTKHLPVRPPGWPYPSSPRRRAAAGGEGRCAAGGHGALVTADHAALRAAVAVHHGSRVVMAGSSSPGVRWVDEGCEPTTCPVVERSVRTLAFARGACGRRAQGSLPLLQAEGPLPHPRGWRAARRLDGAGATARRRCQGWASKAWGNLAEESSVDPWVARPLASCEGCGGW